MKELLPQDTCEEHVGLRKYSVVGTVGTPFLCDDCSHLLVRREQLLGAGRGFDACPEADAHFEALEREYLLAHA